MDVDVDVVPAGQHDSSRREPGGPSAATVVFATTSLFGAALLFVIQPMVARLVLPQFGGSSTVWSTSSLFFQVLLLVGYLYTHVSTQRLGNRRQPLLHFGLLLLPLVALPVALPDALMPDDGSPVWWLLRTLLLTIGLPFAVISTTGPLLQRWYSWTVGRRSADPYFLFATSNLGSFGGLLAYPFLVEPLLTLDQQRLAWSFGFGVFIVLMGACGLIAFRSSHSVSPSPDAVVAAASPRPSKWEVLRWLGLAFLPSTLMLGVTAHISTDVAPIPLMWVVPLAIYLATFVVAFARTSRSVPKGWQLAVGGSVAAATIALVSGPVLPIWTVLVADLAVLMAVAFTAHAELAARRPATDHLTFFYIIVAAGGALGGVLNGLVAPVLFPDVWEYPLALLGAAALIFPHARSTWRVLERRYHPVFVHFLEASAFVILLLGALLISLRGDVVWQAVLALVVAGVFGAHMARRPRALVVALAGVMLLPSLLRPPVVLQDRSFYGSFSVADRDGWRIFSHGTTVHGKQSLDNPGEPSTYYARSGPVGQVFEIADGRSDVATVGLGVGTIAAYGQAGQRMTFFEIDPAVVEVASDPELYTYLSDSAAEIRHVVGDGRLMLEQQSAHSYDLLFLDAFASDSIPVHLLTREAFESYARALRDGGLLMVHISNRIFDLEPVVAAGADHLGWHAAVGRGDADEATGATSSVWVALSPDQSAIDELRRQHEWAEPLGRRVQWSDDFSSVLSVLRFG